jgi:hypothetical protein
MSRRKSEPAIKIEVDGPVMVGTDSGVFIAASGALRESGIRKSRTKSLLTILVGEGEERFIQTVRAQLNTNQAERVIAEVEVV